MAITRLTGGLTPADGGDPRTFPAIWNATAEQIETAQSDIDAVEADVLEAQGDISDLQSQKVAKAGDTMTGDLTLAGAPTEDLHAATKKYVDDSISSVVDFAPEDLDTLSELAAALDDDPNFYVNTVRLASGTPVDGNSIVYSDAEGGWIPGEGGGGGASVTISDTAPADPAEGDMWWNSDSGNLYVYYTDVDGSQWVAANGPQMVVSDTAPAGYQGQLWFDSSQGQMFLYYEDEDSEQWVSANGPQVMVSEVQPDGYQGQLWFDSTTGLTYIYYDDGTTGQWVSAIGGSLAGSVLQVVSTTKTDTFTTTSTSYTDITGLSATITPRSTSSKIMVFFSVDAVTTSGTTNSLGGIQLVRDTTPIALGDSSGSRSVATVGVSSRATSDNARFEYSKNFLDEPSTTSSVTYKLQAEVQAGTMYINSREGDLDNSINYRSVSSITLMEVAG